MGVVRRQVSAKTVAYQDEAVKSAGDLLTPAVQRVDKEGDGLLYRPVFPCPIGSGPDGVQFGKRGPGATTHAQPVAGYDARSPRKPVAQGPNVAVPKPQASSESVDQDDVDVWRIQGPRCAWRAVDECVDKVRRRKRALAGDGDQAVENHRIDMRARPNGATPSSACSRRWEPEGQWSHAADGVTAASMAACGGTEADRARLPGAVSPRDPWSFCCASAAARILRGFIDRASIMYNQIEIRLFRVSCRQPALFTLLSDGQPANIAGHYGGACLEPLWHAFFSNGGAHAFNACSHHVGALDLDRRLSMAPNVECHESD